MSNNAAEKITSIVVGCTSFAALIVAIVELPKAPSMFNLSIALIATFALIGTLAVYNYMIRRKRSGSSEEEQRLRKVFPRIYAFLESIDTIRGEADFERFEGELNQLIEIEKRSRSIRWKEMQDIEAIRGIALAKLVQKKRFFSNKNT